MWSRLSLSMRRGLCSGAFAVALLSASVVPSRVAVAMRAHGSLFDKAVRLFAGATLDLSAVIGIMAALVFLLALVPLALPFLRTRWWQHLGPVLLAWPVGFVVYVLAITSQEMKSERGAFPTMFDLAEGGTSVSFVTGAVGFLRLDRIWVPLVVGTVLALVVAVPALRWQRRSTELVAWRGWLMGVLAAFIAGALVVPAVAAAQAAIANRASPAALGDPLTGLVESTFDMIRHRSAAAPRELVLQVELPEGSAAIGASRLGWPPAGQLTFPAGAACVHPHARVLDFETELHAERASGRALMKALGQVSQQLFDGLDPRVALIQMSIESFRADDIHALNADAAPQIDPFVNQLYATAARGGSSGVLASTKMFQAGVRTAQGLGAMTCGLGSLPYNLSLIRDLLPFAVRCPSDVLRDAGFKGSFFYGSDASFDEMHLFLAQHGYPKLVSQDELPNTLPKGAWQGITDFGVFDAAAQQLAEALALANASPQLALVMSLSNHSPFTPPEDLPASVTSRVDEGLKGSVNRADADDRRRLLTHSYTDLALERFFAKLDELQLSEKSIVVMAADHSTGESYVWGATDPESDAAKTQIPFVIVVPEALMAKVKDRPALEAALAEAQRRLEEAPLSQNDVPALMMALMSAHPAVKALPSAARWHTLGGQVTSPWFVPGGDPATHILGINGVSELYALDRAGARVGDYEDSVFLKTRADRYRVTPRLIPVAATLQETMRNATPCATANETAPAQ